MPRNVTGVYLRPAGNVNPPVSGTVIDPSAFDASQADIAAELTNSLDRLGRGPMQADLPMGGFNVAGAGGIIGRADGSVGSAGQASENFIFNVSSGAPTILASGVPATYAFLNVTAGRWLVSAMCASQPTGGAAASSFEFAISSAAATVSSGVYAGAYSLRSNIAAGATAVLNIAAGQVVAFGVNSTIYFNVNVVFSGGGMGVYGSGGAIRLV